MTAGHDQIRVAFCGPGQPSAQETVEAETIGRLLAAAGCVLYCGGLGGAMESACRGAKAAGGSTVGILPGYEASSANPWIDVPVCTGMGQARNVILVASAEVVVASGGGWGTLSEIALAVRLGKPVVIHGGWAGAFERGQPPTESSLVHLAGSPEICVEIALTLAREGSSAESR